jgi:hypothetical protein
VNNPKQAYLHLRRAIDTVTARHGNDPKRWPPQALAVEFERVLRGSTFAMWGDAKAAAAGRQSRTSKILQKVRALTRGAAA